MATPILSKEDRTYGERYFIPKEKQKMAKKQKNTNTPVITDPSPEALPAAEAAGEATGEAATGQLFAPAQPRAEVILCGRSFYVQAGVVLNFLMLESLLAKASKQDLAELSARYRLRIEVHTAATGDELLVLCENGVVDWGDGEHIVATRLAPAKETGA